MAQLPSRFADIFLIEDRQQCCRKLIKILLESADGRDTLFSSLPMCLALAEVRRLILYPTFII